MATRVGENPTLNPVFIVTASFHKKPVKFSTFVNALKVHYQGDIPSYEDVAIAALQQEGSYNRNIKEGDLNLTPEQQTIIEGRIISFLSKRRSREDQEFHSKGLIVVLILLCAVYAKLYHDILQDSPYFFP